MKTVSLKTLALLFVLSLILGGSCIAMAASPVTNLKTENVKSIEVSGNVHLTIVQGLKEGVQIYDNYYEKSALVQQEGKVLRLSSHTAEPLTVVVSVAQLQTLSVSGTSTVTTSGPITLLSLNVKISGKAKATLGIESVQLISHIQDSGKLRLEGSSEEFQGTLASNGQLELENFSAQNSQVKSSNKVYLANDKTLDSKLESAARFVRL